MAIRKKVVCLLALLGALFLFFILMVEYSYTTNIDLTFLSITKYPIIGAYLPEVIFWLSLSFFCFTFVTSIILLFSPIKKKNIVFASPNGTLNLSLKSIENFVLYSVTENPSIFAPQVKVHLTKKKLKIKILGYMTDSKDLIGNSDGYALQIQENLNHLLGNHSMNVLISMKLKDYEQKARRKNLLLKQRVE
ncbi:alkaline shock response membrane anchor protein AmaP (plasmid) [Carnobacterium maltaromaticum]|uniref:alkaline shock response membrane anchor protein AmaP n=1 Tax=Carnobacterium maltaromaticum TaxID=2751 RepID=UPI003450B4CE